MRIACGCSSGAGWTGITGTGAVGAVWEAAAAGGTVCEGAAGARGATGGVAPGWLGYEAGGGADAITSSSENYPHDATPRVTSCFLCNCHTRSALKTKRA